MLSEITFFKPQLDAIVKKFNRHFVLIQRGASCEFWIIVISSLPGRVDDFCLICGDLLVVLLLLGNLSVSIP